jgi:hypothetical protein
VDFFDGEALVAEVCDLLEDEPARRELGKASRKLMLDRYDLRTICLPRQINWVSSLLDGAPV